MERAPIWVVGRQPGRGHRWRPCFSLFKSARRVQQPASFLTLGHEARETMGRIHLVTFDVLHTIISPRQLIHVQYAEVFKPYVGPLEPDAIKASFKTGGCPSFPIVFKQVQLLNHLGTALKAVQKELPAYQHGAPLWWSEVIKRTALGAGADPRSGYSSWTAPT